MSIRVHFAVCDDECAEKVEALLEGLGYEARRDLAEVRDLFGTAAVSAARRHELTAREREMLEAMLRGQGRRDIAETLRVSQTTVKWHFHNIYAKLGVVNSEAALRKSLYLDDPRWLCAPLRHRDGLERLVDAAHLVLHARKSGQRFRLNGALMRLEDELAVVRRDALLEPPSEPILGDDQWPLAGGSGVDPT